MARSIGATLTLKDGNFFTNIKSASAACGNLKTSLSGATSTMKTHGAVTETVGTKLKSLAKTVVGVVAAYASISAIKEFGNACIEAANAQTEAEERLQTTMSNVQGTTQAQIDTIKNYAGELQKVTTVGDEVSIMGASQLATFQLQADTIQTLMPALTDLAVAQYGVTVSGDQMKSMANLVGKVMNGSTSALTRYGVVMNDTQQNILKTGTESEKAATMVEVLSQNFGGLAEAMANTPEGRIQQLKNAWDDVQEVIGAKLYPAMTNVLNWMASKLPSIEDALKRVVDAISPAIDWITATAIPAVGNAIGGIVQKIGEIISACAPALSSLKDAVASLLQKIGESLNGDAFSGITNAVKSVLPGLISAVSSTVQFISDHWSILEPILSGVLSGFLAYKSISGVSSIITGVGSKFTSVFGGLGQGISIIKNLGSAFSTLTSGSGIIGTLKTIPSLFSDIGSGIKGISGAGSIVTGLGKAFTFLSSPIGIAVVFIGAAIAAGVLIYKNWDKLKEMAINLWNKVKEVFENIKNKVSEVWDNIKNSAPVEFLSNIFGGVKEAASTVWSAAKDTVVEKLNNIKSAYEEHGGGVKGIAYAAMESVKGYYTAGYTFIDNLTGGKLSALVDTVKEKFGSVSGYFSGAWENIKSTFSNVWDAIKATAQEKMNNIKSAYEEHGGGIKGVAYAAMEGVKGYYTAGYTFIDNLTGGKLSEIVGTMKEKFAPVAEFFSNTWENVKGAFSTAFDALKETAQEKLDNIKIAYEEHGGGLKGAAYAAMEGVKGYYTAGYDYINNLTGGKLSEVVATIQEKFAPVIEFFSGVWETIKTTFFTVWNSITEFFSTIFGTLQASASNLWNGISSAAQTAFSFIRSTVQTVISTICNIITTIKTTFSNVFDAIKNTVSSVFDTIKTTISNAWDSLKSLIKTPHIEVTGTMSIAGVDTPIPKLGLKWYAEGGIMTRPTIFGANGNNVFGGGEAGHEAVLPLDVLWERLGDFADRIVNGGAQPARAAAVTNNNNITVTVEGGGDDTDLPNKVAKRIVEVLNNM